MRSALLKSDGLARVDSPPPRRRRAPRLAHFTCWVLVWGRLRPTPPLHLFKCSAAMGCASSPPLLTPPTTSEG
eukprot:3367403-Pyramimonas_sp.AAC.1